MKKEKVDIIIVGGGLSGLVSAYYLKQQGKSAFILEAQGQLGGRIRSLDSQIGLGKLEMGATWFGEKHILLNKLLEELKVERFQQFNEGNGVYEVMSFVPPQLFSIPPGQEPYFRIKGGSEALIKALAKSLDPEMIHLNTKITQVEDIGEFIQLYSDDGRLFQAKTVITTVPQRLLSKEVSFEPSLPETVQSRMENINAWMSDSIKFTVEYASPFWRKKGMAGLAISQTGIAQEVQDHSSEDGHTHALMGFLSRSAQDMTQPEREENVIKHLIRLYGVEAKDYLNYMDYNWHEDTFLTPGNDSSLTFKFNFGHPDFRMSFFNDKLLLSGTETAFSFPGYMEGAVAAGQFAVQRLLSPEVTS